jgi:hypothetical protein
MAEVAFIDQNGSETLPDCCNKGKNLSLRGASPALEGCCVAFLFVTVVIGEFFLVFSPI